MKLNYIEKWNEILLPIKSVVSWDFPNWSKVWLKNTPGLEYLDPVYDIAEKGYDFFIDSPTNQQFIIIENSRMKELKKSVKFSFWEKYDDSHTVVRFATSWATTKENIDKLLKLM